MPDILVTDLRGGRNGIDNPMSLPANQCVEALNVDWSDNALGRKRGGSVSIPIAGGTQGSGAFVFLYRHVPTGDETAAELWGITSTGVVKRLVGGTLWADVTLKDAITGRPQDASAATLNGKLYLAYGSAVDRLHVFDPRQATVRRVGLAAPGLPTVTNTGSGSYAATLRYYRVRVIDYDGTTVFRRSEPSPSVAFTPSGSGTAARVTLGTVPSENETHWEIEVSTDNAVFYVLYGVSTGNAIVIGTTHGDDTSLPAAWILLDTSEEVGQFDLPRSVQYVTSDGNRLLMGGLYGTTPSNTSRIWFTPVLGSSDHGDDERVPFTDSQQNFVDLNEKDGGRLTGLTYAIQGLVFAFKYRQTWKLIPTGIVEQPYLVKKISNVIGCIYDKTIVMMEDTTGNPCVGFLSYRGPYRLGSDGLVYIGRDWWDIWRGLKGQPRINIEAATVVAHGVWYYDLRQVWWYIALNNDDSPSIKLCVDITFLTRSDQFGLRGGWSRHEGASCKAACSVMFATSIGASMSRDLKPYVGFRAPV